MELKIHDPGHCPWFSDSAMGFNGLALDERHRVKKKKKKTRSEFVATRDAVRFKHIFIMKLKIHGPGHCPWLSDSTMGLNGVALDERHRVKKKKHTHTQTFGICGDS
jgi:hypothetical protein